MTNVPWCTWFSVRSVPWKKPIWKNILPKKIQGYPISSYILSSQQGVFHWNNPMDMPLGTTNVLWWTWILSKSILWKNQIIKCPKDYRWSMSYYACGSWWTLFHQNTTMEKCPTYEALGLTNVLWYAWFLPRSHPWKNQMERCPTLGGFGVTNTKVLYKVSSIEIIQWKCLRV